MFPVVMAVSSIRTDRLLLRPLRWEDQEPLHRLWNDPEVRRYLWDDQPVSRETVAEQIEISLRHFETYGFGAFALFPLQEPDLLIGFAGLRPFGEGKDIELLYALDPAWWGSGLATEAAFAVLRFGFEEIGLEQIDSGADPPNLPSFQLMERLGMRFAYDTALHGLPARYYRLRRGEFKPAPGRYELKR
jgi:RimJ/RimL family protein N-acetyltransferase